MQRHHRFGTVRATVMTAALALAAGLPAPVHAQQAQAGSPGHGRVTYTVAPSGNEARYRVREQLARIDFPSDAVGVTQNVTGVLTFGADGSVVRDESHFTIDLASLTSDADRRDNYIRRRTLVTDTFPTAVFVPTKLEGVTFPLADGEHTVRMSGDLTIRNVTRAVTWDVTLQVNGDVVSGQAKTAFTFERFELAKPRVGSVLSVDDEIRLEYDFRLVRATQ